MANYTRLGSAALDQIIDGHLQQVAEVARTHARAGILLGGYGRGEGTPFIHADGSQAPFNDYDLVVIVDKLTPAVKSEFQSLEKQLTKKVGLPVGLYPYPISHLRKCDRSMLNYEMKQGHKVVWGDENILSAMPDFPIPLSEGSRLLLNRGKLLLDIKRRLSGADPLTEEESIRFIKFIHKVWLAFGDAALLVAGHYDISYSIKKERLPMLGNLPDRDLIIEGYLKAVALKEWGNFQPLENFDLEAEFIKTTEVYQRFFSWYRKQYSARECSILKAVALNLKWNRSFSTQHPRIKLYHTILELLQDQSTMSHERFYMLQRRFS
ncbi:MAG: hypothetical protein OES84_00805 [Kiritimatiellaceae bacterium]|nr:hypothetical protein [Kiritimatiellaceae bacterium]